MRKQGEPTKYPGVFRVGEKVYLVRAKITDPRNGRSKEVVKLLNGLSAQQAARQRAELIENAKSARIVGERVRVGDFARSWLKSKALKVDPSTARTYADGLERHVLPDLGDFFYDALATADVQAWVDKKLSETKKSPKGGKKPRFSVPTVHGWFRTFRTMTRDAMEPLNLQRDPTLRVTFPPEPEREHPNCLSPQLLSRFLDEMRTNWPQHHALTVMLAFTGMRFCHASALRWDDLDEENAVVRVVRKHHMGRVGQVSRKKRVPRELPLEAPVLDVLRWHRQRLIAEQAPGLAEGWMFPSDAGTLRQPSSLYKAWAACAKAAGVKHRFTVHGLRYTFNDLTRRAGVNGIVTRSLTGHVTEEMTRHYSTVGLDEKRAAVASVLRLVPMTAPQVEADGGGGVSGGVETPKANRPIDASASTGRDP